MSGFVHLHLHSEYSLLDGACRINDILKKAKELGQASVAITDHGVMYGCVDFYNAAKEAGIKPIIGCEVYVAPRTMYDKEHRFDSDNNHLVLLVKNKKGYENLLKIVSKAFIEGFYIKPRTDMNELRAHSEGLIALSACLAGAVPQRILADDIDGARKLAAEYKEIFGEDYYLELQNHGINEQLAVNRELEKISRELDIPLVATNDVHYINKEDAYMQNVLMCVQTAKTIDDENAMAFPTEEFYMKSEDEMRQLFGRYENAIENTVKIADKCNFDFEFGNFHLPKYQLPDDREAYEYLCEQVKIGFDKRFPNASDELVERMQYELTTIRDMGYVDYFLIVWDFVKFAKDRDIPVGPGRGSAAGSIVSYCLGITDINPIKYNLIFERFLNPERITMPDIDIDFCTERRQEVIDYVVSKYGRNKVAQIVTFGTFAAKGAIRDVGRVLNVPYGDVDRIAKLVPNDYAVRHKTLMDAVKEISELGQLYQNDPAVHNLIDTAAKIEGMPRHSSIHAAGIVITGEDVDCYVPLQKSDELAITQYTMTTLERLGLLKMDFLALRNLTVIKYAENIINHGSADIGGKGEFRVEEQSFDDPEVYKMLSEGNTSGVFQLESNGMRQMLCEMKPTCFEDIIAAISLYRPGPMDSIPTYIANMHYPERVNYATPLLEPILNMTYGCIVYQEQVMQIFRELAGYSFGKADLVRRAMSKKKADVLEKERHAFIYGKEGENCGCVANGIDEKTATKLFDDMASFASYAFNKSHAAAYAAVAYRTAYLKCRYPCEYMAALLTSVIGNTDKVVEYIAECNNIGIKILPPDVNKSFIGFSVSENAIRFGLVAIKSIGFGVIEELVKERNHDGEFLSFEDFLKRMDNTTINKKAVQMLINAGALDSLGLKRSQMLQTYETMMDSIAEIGGKTIEGQMDMFGQYAESNVFSQVYPDIPELPKLELLRAERDAVGLYVSGHPLSEYDEEIKNIAPVSIRKIIDSFKEDGENIVKDNDTVVITAVVTSFKLKHTKNNSVMAFVGLDDGTASLEMIVFAKTLEKFRGVLTENNVIVAEVRVSAREDEPVKAVLGSACNIKDYKTETKVKPATLTAGRKLYIKVPDMESDKLKKALNICRVFDGPVPLIVYTEDDRKYHQAARGLWVEPCHVLLRELKGILGEKNVVEKSD